MRARAGGGTLFMALQQKYAALEREAVALRAENKELKVLVHSSFEYFNGEWEPDDIDRAKFLEQLKRFEQ
jgi:hypothetical protein